MTKWTYHVFKFSRFAGGGFFRGPKINDDWLAKELNALGAEGWEIASVFSSALMGGETDDIVLIMKRPA